MTRLPPSPPPAPAEATSPGGLLRAEAGALIVTAVVTVALTCGVYALGRWRGVNEGYSVLAGLAAMTAWTALAAPVLAAGGRSVWASLLRGGVVADAAGVALLVLWAVARLDGQAVLPLLVAVEIYAVLVAVVLAAIAAVCCARTEGGRYALAAATAVLLAAALASPLWTGGLLADDAGVPRQTVVAAAVHFNPFYSVTAALAEHIPFVWHHAGMLYRWTRIGDYAAPPPVSWYSAAWRYAAAAGVLGLLAAVRRAGGRRSAVSAEAPAVDGAFRRTGGPPGLDG